MKVSKNKPLLLSKEKTLLTMVVISIREDRKKDEKN